MALFLLLKTHNKTGLKYLCKKEADTFDQCVSYPGSGTYWRRHLRNHGKDVSTECIFCTEDKERFRRVAIRYSDLLEVESSSSFANLCREEGQGGRTIYGEMLSSLTKAGITDEIRKKRQESAFRIWETQDQTERKKAISNRLTGVKKSESHKKALSEAFKMSHAHATARMKNLEKATAASRGKKKPEGFGAKIAEAHKRRALARRVVT